MNFLCTSCQKKIGCDIPKKNLFEGLLCATCKRADQGLECPEYIDSILLHKCSKCRMEAYFVREDTS